MTLKTLIGAAAALALTAGAGSALADTPFQAHHPRREEVNHRLAHQNHRIAMARREGELNAAQARDLHAEDRGLRAQERFASSRDHGHITRGEQRRLNRQENAVSRQIGR